MYFSHSPPHFNTAITLRHTAVTLSGCHHDRILFAKKIQLFKLFILRNSDLIKEEQEEGSPIILPKLYSSADVSCL